MLRGKWYDFYTGKFAGDGEVITITPGLDNIPVFVKDGAIIPLMPPLLHAPTSGQRIDLEIRHYGEKEGSYQLYDDGGETFDYAKGQYSWRTITVKRNKSGQWQGHISAPERGKPNTVGNISWRFM